PAVDVRGGAFGFGGGMLPGSPPGMVPRRRDHVETSRWGVSGDYAPTRCARRGVSPIRAYYREGVFGIFPRGDRVLHAPRRRPTGASLQYRAGSPAIAPHRGVRGGYV